MPPKRSHAPKADETVNENNANNVNASNNDAESLPLKKQKVDETPQINNKNQDTPSQGSQDSSNNDDSDLPVCVYGAKCYRKNPQHFKEYRHPKVGDADSGPKTPQISPSKSDFSEHNNNNNVKAHSDNNISKKDSDYSPPPKAHGHSNSPSLDAYRGILEFALSKHKISADDKRSLREYRRKNGISDQDHFHALKQLGWTEDEYDDGEKKIDDDIDLQEEKEVYDKPDGFKVITIKKEDAHKTKERLHTFSKVCTKFYETMSKSQANYTVTEVGVIVNSKLFHKYRNKKLQLNKNLGGEVKEDWGFHGTSRESILKIANSNFLLPDDLKKLNLAAAKDDKKGKGKKKPVKQKPIELLDDGYFGKGIYFTKYADYALWYSEERESDQVLLSKLIVGNAFQCNKRMDGQGLKPGYDCHISPKGNEVVIFDTDQILPRYIITYVEKPAEEREQES